MAAAVGALLKSLAVEPPIKPGTPDPYAPPEPGGLRPEEHLQVGLITQYVTSLVKSHDEPQNHTTASSLRPAEDGDSRFLHEGRHQTLQRAFRDCGYLPMIELLRYLEANGSTTYIASGGDRDFMRPVTQGDLWHPARAWHRQLEWAVLPGGRAWRLGRLPGGAGSGGRSSPAATRTETSRCCSSRVASIQRFDCCCSTTTPSASSTTRRGQNLVGAGRGAGVDDHTKALVTLVVGILLLGFPVLAVIRGHAGPPTRTPGWMRAIDTAGVRVAFSLGLALAVLNPNVPILVAGLATIAAANVSVAGQVGGAIFLLAASELGVLGPTAGYVTHRESAKRELAAVKAGLAAHEHWVNLIVLVVFGALFTFNGISGL